MNSTIVNCLGVFSVLSQQMPCFINIVNGLVAIDGKEMQEIKILLWKEITAEDRSCTLMQT